MDFFIRSNMLSNSTPKTVASLPKSVAVWLTRSFMSSIFTVALKEAGVGGWWVWSVGVVPRPARVVGLVCDVRSLCTGSRSYITMTNICYENNMLFRLSPVVFLY